MFLGCMSHKPVTIPIGRDIDWKGIGYLFSIAGVLFLGAKAMPEPYDPSWHWAALIAGVAASIVGFVLRYLAHLREKREIEQAEADAKRG
jgi:hypothetical protein